MFFSNELGYYYFIINITFSATNSIFLSHFPSVLVYKYHIFLFETSCYRTATKEIYSTLDLFNIIPQC